jgi:hypothetical protein
MATITSTIDPTLINIAREVLGAHLTGAKLNSYALRAGLYNMFYVITEGMFFPLKEE